MSTVIDALKQLPGFSGEVLSSPDERQRTAEDFGHFVHEVPLAVIRPRSAEDIARVVRFARQEGMKVVARGMGQSTYGQAQVEGGLVIDMAQLHQLHALEPTSAWVDAGLLWRDLLRASLAHGRAPPVLTDYLLTTVGGTLAVGGIGTQSYRRGAQTDHVLELEVVDGHGNLVTCSPERSRELFNACRAGLGQFGIVTKARLRLEPAPPSVRVYRTFYSELGPFVEDLSLLTARKEFDGVQGAVMPNELSALKEMIGPDVTRIELPRTSGPWLFMIKATQHFGPESAPDDAWLLRGLRHAPRSQYAQERGYLSFFNRMEPWVQALKAAGLWDIPHPWMNAFLPSEQVLPFIEDTLAHVPPEWTRYGFIPVYPYAREPFQTPFLRVPDTSCFFLFGILGSLVSPTPESTRQGLEAVRRLYERCLSLGGVRYPVDSIPLREGDGPRHYGPLWPTVLEFRRKFDPGRIFAQKKKSMV
ncbi:FAD-binding protein [Archangium minus]|uniref:FAD-binding protein n=1 Tax=Archangium minus TaxID=83450 RepID=A0ABY9WR83_9BACT|nr:FAD-binding protein [Archangium minus]